MTSGAMNLQAVDRFWEWFSEKEGEIRRLWSQEHSQELTQMLHPKVKELSPRLQWELGPAGQDRVFLAISPGGDPELLSLTERVVARAPRLSGWQFYEAKPARDWKAAFRFSHQSGHYELDATGWEYSLVAFDGGSFFDVTLYVGGSLDSVPQQIWGKAVRVVLDGVLGERMCMETIDQIHIEGRAPSDKPRGKLGFLKQHVTELSRPRSARKVGRGE